MTPYEKVSVQTFLMCALRGQGSPGMTETMMLHHLRVEGYTTITEPDLMLEVRGLADHAWITPYDPPIGTRRWRITTLGESILKEQGI